MTNHRGSLRLSVPVRRRRNAALIVLALVSGACTPVEEGSAGSTEAPLPEEARADSAAVTTVWSSSNDHPLGWDFERVLVLGGVDEGPTAFFRVFASSIGVDSSGNLYVLDAGNYRVTKFDPNGRPVLSFGQQGGGPGEFGFPSDMAVGADGDVGVYDFDRRGLSRFDADGEFTGMLPLPGPLQRQVALLDDGGVVAAVTQRTPNPDSTDFKLLLIREDTTEITSVRQFTNPEPREFSCGAFPGPSYFGPRVDWAAAGRRIAFSDESGYTVRVLDAAGSVSVWGRDLAPIESTLELAAWEVAQGDSLRLFGCTVPAREAASQFGYADVAPMIESLALTPSGGVWVRRRTEVPGVFAIDVLDGNGTYVGTLPGDSPFPAAFRGEDEVVVVERDEFDRPIVVVYRISKG